MSLYVDSSALLKRYLDEDDAAQYDDIMRPDPYWTTARHTAIEVRRTLSLRLSGADRAQAKRHFASDWDGLHIVELNEAVCEAAAQIAEVTSVRTLDALHLGAAQHVGGGALPIVTADARQAQAARSLGWTVLGR